MGRHSRKGPAPRGSGSRVGKAGPPAGEGEARPTAPTGERDHAAPAYGTPAHGVPQVRGGHPEHHEPGGGWGGQQRYGDWQAGTSGGGGRQQTRPAPSGTRRVPGPRREFIDAFDAPEQSSGTDAGAASVRKADPYARDGGPDGGADSRGARSDADPEVAQTDGGRTGRGGPGRTFTGIVAAAVTTVLAVVVAGQVGDPSGTKSEARPVGGLARDGGGEPASRSNDGRAAPAPRAPAAPPTYAQSMAKKFPLAADLDGTGDFEAVAGLAEAPGKGRKVPYRIDIEKGLGLDPKLFADAVQKTLNDDRSWAHNGAMTFERISSGSPEFVITLASPGTTAEWCAKSGLDTTVDNVSCDSASTDRVMINAYRWAQGAKTYGDKAMFAYRQMLINHEVGHRLGHGHVSCRTPGAPAPVMQQQTKTLNLDGVKCKPNPWVHPGS